MGKHKCFGTIFLFLVSIVIIALMLTLTKYYLEPNSDNRCNGEKYDTDKARCVEIPCSNSIYIECPHKIVTFEDEKRFAEEQVIARETARIEQEKRQKCWDEGKDYNYSLDIMKDYNLSCKQITYINDHLIDKTRQVDGGYIKGYYSGFVSYGEVKGQFYQYVTEGILATGQLVKHISFHLNCDNTTLEPTLKTICSDGKWFPYETGYCVNGQTMFRDTKKIEYYTESDFVMYYVKNCLEE